MFIINTITKWDEPPRARHQVANALAKKHQIVFVSANKLGFPGFSRQKVNANLSVIVPSYPIDQRIRRRVALLNKLYQRWLFRRLVNIYGDSSVINFDFTARYLHKYFLKTIYYCNDDHIAMSYKFNAKFTARYHEKCERIVAQNSVLCIGTSKFLTNRLFKYNKNSIEIRLGAPDISDNFMRPSPGKDDLINVGFVGFGNTFDLSLVEYLLTKEGVKCTLVGPMDQSIHNKFQNFDNIHFSGELRGEKLYNEVSKFNIGLVPYNLKATIDRTPNKLWLYLALGVPVVVSNIPSIKDWRFPDKSVYRSNSIEDFYKYIQEAYREDSDALANARIQFAKQHTWDKRIEEFLSHYNKLI